MSDNKSDSITDGNTGIGITVNDIVKYLGQQINSNGISEQIMEKKIFGKIKMIHNNNNFLTTLSKIHIFKTYMITKVNNLLPLISLN